SLLVVDDEADAGEIGRLVIRKYAFQALPFVRRVAEAETGGDFAGEAAPSEVIDGARGGLELILVIALRPGHQLGHRGLFLGVLRILAAPLVRHAQAEIAGQFLDCIDKAQALVRHDEADGAAMRAAAEAVVELLGRADGERRGLFRMEGAAGAVVGAGLLERHVALDDVDDVDAIQQLLDKAVRNHALTPSALQASAALTSLETSPMSAR